MQLLEEEEALIERLSISRSLAAPVHVRQTTEGILRHRLPLNCFTKFSEAHRWPSVHRLLRGVAQKNSRRSPSIVRGTVP